MEAAGNLTPLAKGLPPGKSGLARLVGAGAVDQGDEQSGLKSAGAWEENLLKLAAIRKTRRWVVASSANSAFLLTLASLLSRGAPTPEARRSCGNSARATGQPKDETVPLAAHCSDPSRIWYDAAVSMRTSRPLTKRFEQKIRREAHGRRVGFRMVIHADGPCLRFAGEGGLHFSARHQRAPGRYQRAKWQEYTPPAGMDRRGNIGRKSASDLRSARNAEDPRLPGKLYASVAICRWSADVQSKCLTRNLQEILNS